MTTKIVATAKRRIDLTRHKISDRETSGVGYAGKRWIANTQNVDRRFSRGSLHRLVRWPGREAHFICKTYQSMTRLSVF